MLKILKIILVLSLQISIISTSFAEIKLRGPADGKYKIENKIFQITEEMLDDKAFQNLSDEIKQNSEIAKTLSKDNQIKDVIKLRGPGKNIFAQYADSVFLISNSSGKGTIGTGSLIDPSGLLLTNAHVVAGATTVRVFSRPPVG